MFLRKEEVMVDFATVPMEEIRFAVNYEKVIFKLKELIKKCRQKRRDRLRVRAALVATLNARQT